MSIDVSKLALQEAMKRSSPLKALVEELAKSLKTVRFLDVWELGGD